MDDIIIDIIIIGGGISGAYCFRELSKSLSESSVYLFEARDRFGGRTCTSNVIIDDGDTFQVDVGGQWLGVKHTLMLDLCKEMSLELEEQAFPSSSSSSSSLVEIAYYKLKELDNISKEEVKKFQDHMEKISILIKNNEKINSSYLNISFYDELCKFCTSIYAQEEFLFFIQTVLAVDAKNCSFIFAIYYIYIYGDGMDDLGDGPEGSQALKVKGGMQQISEYLVNQSLILNNNNLSLIHI